MNKLVLLVLILIPAVAAADDEVSPYGTSPFVVAYQPPPKLERAHHGFTLEFALGGGSTSVEQSSGGATLALGGWVTHDLALAFRASSVGSFGFVGGSLQYYATRSVWLGGGVGGMSERTMDPYGGEDRHEGSGAFLRAGVELTHSGPHSLYLSGELQAGVNGGVNRDVALLSLGYQML